MKRKFGSLVEYRPDIGMYSIDRPASSCRWATTFCHKNCYVRKFYLMGRIKPERDFAIETFWLMLTGEALRKILSQKRHPIDRLRLGARGEMLSTRLDITRVFGLCVHNPETTFWLPTRAWREPTMRQRIERELFPLKNLKILASLDPSNSPDEVKDLAQNGWSTYFFGDNTKTLIKPYFRCPKTWHNLKGTCYLCSRGCFSDRQVHVWTEMKRKGKVKNSLWT